MPCHASGCPFEVVIIVLKMPCRYHDNQRDAIQILHYNQSDRYIVHTDWFSAGGYEGWNTTFIGNTNRYATVFFYLNDPEAGGHTVFPRAKVSLCSPLCSSIDVFLPLTLFLHVGRPTYFNDLQCDPGAMGQATRCSKGHERV